MKESEEKLKEITDLIQEMPPFIQDLFRNAKPISGGESLVIKVTKS